MATSLALFQKKVIFHVIAAVGPIYNHQKHCDFVISPTTLEKLGTSPLISGRMGPLVHFESSKKWRAFSPWTRPGGCWQVFFLTRLIGGPASTLQRLLFPTIVGIFSWHGVFGSNLKFWDIDSLRIAETLGFYGRKSVYFYVSFGSRCWPSPARIPLVFSPVEMGSKDPYVNWFVEKLLSTLHPVGNIWSVNILNLLNAFMNFNGFVNKKRSQVLLVGGFRLKQIFFKLNYVAKDKHPKC